MQITKKFLTDNDCYKQGSTITPTGIMVHSTATPGVMNDAFFEAFNKPGLNKCVHAFVDDSGVLQTLPWDTLGWHSGTGALGKSKNANNSYIGFEICEPKGHTYSYGTMVGYDIFKNREYFDKVYNTSVELCVYLCRMFGIKPENIICHSEGHTKGIASDHSDVMQWFPKHGKTMDTFRNDVKKKLGGDLMRKFKLLEEMNFRETPNGTKLGVIPKDYVVTGTSVEINNGISWLYTTYNGMSGFVAVLPESKNYAVEIVTEETDKNNCEDELAFYKTAYEELNGKLARIKDIIKEI